MIDKQNMAVPAFHKFIYPILKEIVHKERVIFIKKGLI